MLSTVIEKKVYGKSGAKNCNNSYFLARFFLPNLQIRRQIPRSSDSSQVEILQDITYQRTTF